MFFLTIPSLTGGNFSGHEALESRAVASVRIRVENAIRRLKEYRIFSGTLCNRLNKELDEQTNKIASLHISCYDSINL